MSVVKYGLPVPAAKITIRALLQVPHGAAADVGLAHRRHRDRRLHPGRDAGLLLDHALHRQRVDDRAEHAHVVGGRALHPGRGQRAAAEDVAAADHQAELDAQRVDGGAIVGELAQDPAVVAVLAVAQQRLARHLEQDAAEPGPGAGWPRVIGRAPRCAWRAARVSGRSDAGELRHLGGEIVGALLDALAQRQADEARDLDRARRAPWRRPGPPPSPASRGRSRSLLEQHRLLVELAQPALDHLLDDVLGLAGCTGLLGVDRALALEHGRVEPVGASTACGLVAATCIASCLPSLGQPRLARRSTRAPPARRSCRGPAPAGCAGSRRRRPAGTSR